MTDLSQSPVLVGFVSNLMYTPRIESAALGLGYQVVWIDSLPGSAPQDAADAPSLPAPAAGGAVVNPYAGRSLGEPLLGPGAQLIERLTRLRPALIVFDLDNAAVAWREWLPLIKSVPATRRYPVLCFGPHVDAEALKTARDAGAEAVMARSRFFSELPALIQKHSRRIDAVALNAACQAPLAELARQGLERFNRGEYFAAHEDLETAWLQDDSPARDAYRGILQVAVAYLHIQRGNYAGALKMFLRMRQWLDPLPDSCQGIDIARLRADAQAAYERVLELGPEQIARFEPDLLRPVQYERD